MADTSTRRAELAARLACLQARAARLADATPRRGVRDALWRVRLLAATVGAQLRHIDDQDTGQG